MKQLLALLTFAIVLLGGGLLPSIADAKSLANSPAVAPRPQPSPNLSRAVLLSSLSKAGVKSFVSNSIAAGPVADPGPGANCVTNVGYTIKDGLTIRGSGSMACGGRRDEYTWLNVVLERRLVGGWWVQIWFPPSATNEKTGYSPLNWALSVAYSCRGMGWQTFRTRVQGGRFGSTTQITTLTSNELSVYCGWLW
jgi:hypothetical protein